MVAFYKECLLHMFILYILVHNNVCTCINTLARVCALILFYSVYYICIHHIRTQILVAVILSADVHPVT